MLEEEVELRVAARVHRDLKQGQEDVLQHLLEVGQLLLSVVHVTVDRSTGPGSYHWSLTAHMDTSLTNMHII